MSKVLIVGAGGVGGVVAHKCAMNPEVFTDILGYTRIFPFIKSNR